MLVIGVVGKSGSGKTTFIVKLIKKLSSLGYKCSVIKHASQGFDVKGKDTFKFTAGGAKVTSVVSGNGYAIFKKGKIKLKELILKMGPNDLMLIEGHSNSVYPKILVGEKAYNKKYNRVLLTLDKNYKISEVIKSLKAQGLKK